MVTTRSSKNRTGTRSSRKQTRPRKHSRSDWQELAIFGAGLALGITIGAAAALLSAPRTGGESRALVRAYAGRKRRALGERSHAAWLQLRDELRRRPAEVVEMVG